jgi:hypothetical protein
MKSKAHTDHPEVPYGPRHGAGDSTDGHSDWFTKQADQAADRPTRDRAGGAEVHGLPDAELGLGIACEHAGGVWLPVTRRTSLASTSRNACGLGS